MAVILQAQGTAIDREVSLCLGRDLYAPDVVELMLSANDGSQEVRAWIPMALLHDLAITLRERVDGGELAIEAEEGWSGYLVRPTCPDRGPGLRLAPQSFRTLLAAMRHLPPGSYGNA